MTDATPHRATGGTPPPEPRGPSWAVLLAVGFLVSVLLGALLYATAPIEIRFAPAAGDPSPSAPEPTPPNGSDGRG